MNEPTLLPLVKYKTATSLPAPVLATLQKCVVTTIAISKVAPCEFDACIVIVRVYKTAELALFAKLNSILLVACVKVA